MATYMSMPTASHLHMFCKNKKNESKKGLCVLINNAIWWQDNEDILLANTRTAATCCQTREGSRETVTSNFKGHCTVPQMIPRRKMIPKMDRKWSSTASDPIVDRKWSREKWRSGKVWMYPGCQRLFMRGFRFGLASVLWGSFVTYSFLPHKYRTIFQRPFLRGLFLKGLIYVRKFAFQNRLG